MRIGILTQPLHKNYGGLLQNYALQQVLNSMGHEVRTIDHGAKPVSSVHSIVSVIKSYLLQTFFPTRCKIAKYIPNANEVAIIRHNTDYFINKYISRTKVLHDAKEFDNITKINEYDAYIVGSDQCWRPIYNGSFLLEMFLRFAEHQVGIKRIAYAVSFGTDEWEFTPAMTDKCTRLVKKFDFVSVREKSGVELCRKHFGIDAVFVLDPTMLLDKENYIKLVENEKEPQSSGNLFYYILDPCEGKKSLIGRVAAIKHLIPFTVMPKYQAENRTKDDVKKRLADCVFPSVTSWLRAFMDAEMVIVDSFHGAVFSIIFNKPFWVIGNPHRGNARFESLLSLFELEDRMVTTEDEIDWYKTINWGRVNDIIYKP